MKTIGIFYGSSTGTTEGIAKRIAEKLGVEDKDIHDVSNASPADVALSLIHISEPTRPY